jgi:transposase
MFYCGIDIAKHNHEGVVIDAATGEPLSGSISFPNSKAGCKKLLTLFAKHNIPASELVIGMEATGHYWLALYAYLTDQGYCVRVINPLQSEALRGFFIRKTKNDSVDSFVIAQVMRMGQYRKESLRDSADPIPLRADRGNSYTRMAEENIVAMRLYSCHRLAMVDTVSDYKRRVIALLDQVFPEYAKLFSDIFGVSSSELLLKYPTPEDMLAVSAEQLAELLEKASCGRLGEGKAKTLQSAAKETFGVKHAHKAFAFEIRQIISQIRFTEQQIEDLEKEISSLLKQCGTYITTIPGIGDTLGAVILSEIGDINRFDAPEKLVAYAGLDVTVNQSGEFSGTQNHLSKRGSPYLRRALWLAAIRAAFCDPTLSKHYESLKARGKHHNVAIGSVARKMCNIVFTILKENRPYEPLPPKRTVAQSP